MERQTQPQKFSEHFGLHKNQDELDFLDIYANQDMPLFLDPYGISAVNSKWARECESEIATYFQFLIDTIKDNDSKTTKKLLGYSNSTPKGRGIGNRQADDLLHAFKNSQAALSGDIRDIADCALMIPGINRDKVSDITANILKRQLIKYTQEQCAKYNIPVSRRPVNNTFNHETFEFTSFFADLPSINGNAKILVPISCVRHVPELSKDKYYRNFVLEYLRAEHSHAGDSLASVLKNGAIKVRIADLKKKYPMDTDFLYQFSKEHPSILEKYKSELRRTAAKREKPVLKTNPKKLDSADRIRILGNIPPGNNDATNFFKIAFDNLIYIFDSRLSNPQSEVKINEGRKRIDIAFSNNDQTGFFHQLNVLYHVKCPKIFFECKNYSGDIANPEIDQLQGRFSNHRGRFGILVCRNISNKELILQRCKDVMHQGNGFILVLDDQDIIELLNFRTLNEQPRIDEFLAAKLDNLIM